MKDSLHWAYNTTNLPIEFLSDSSVTRSATMDPYHIIGKQETLQYIAYILQLLTTNHGRHNCYINQHR